MSETSRSRKYLLTINNPTEHGFTHDYILEIMQKLNWHYFCLCDEIGAEGTYHSHLFIAFTNGVSFDRVKSLFPTAHIDKAQGTAKENRDYIRKEGKYLNSAKKETNIPETFEEYGEIPQEKDEKNKKQSAQVLEMIENGATNMEIIRAFPSYGTKAIHLDSLRQTYLEEEFGGHRREDLEVIYIWGGTGTGKTRYVLDKHGDRNVYKTTNYTHPFDAYKGEKIILLDEFRSGIPLADMLQYIDIYPCRLSARYSDKIACYNLVYIVSNIPLDKQYPNKQLEEKETFNAFLRRINRCFKFDKNEYNPVSPLITEEIVESYMLK